VIASIHQSSTSTFTLLDKVLLLSGGKQQFFGPVHTINTYFDGVGYPIPQHTNPAEYVLELLNSDFGHDYEQARSRLAALQQRWADSEQGVNVSQKIEASVVEEESIGKDTTSSRNRNMASAVLTLVHRSFIKSYRYVVAYGIRIAMYLGEKICSRLSPLD